METQQPQTTPQSPEQKKPSKFRKWMKRIGVAAAVIFLALWIPGVFAPPDWDKKFLASYRNWLEESRETAYQKKLQKIEDAYRNDFDGGKTPEETIDLLVAALKAGDIEKASKYWKLSEQEENYNDLKQELEKLGNLQQSIDYFIEVSKKGTRWCNEKNDGCTFRYVYTETATTTYDVKGMNQKIIVPAGEKTTEIIDLELNRLTGVWKIELP